MRKADTPEKLEVVIQAIRQEMEPGGRYEYLNEYNRRTVEFEMERMLEILTEAGSVGMLTQEEKTELLNRQERANGILAHGAADRVVCEHTPPTGSHIPMTECKTVRELALRRLAWRSKQIDMENAQRALDQPTGDRTEVTPLPMGLHGGN